MKAKEYLIETKTKSGETFEVVREFDTLREAKQHAGYMLAYSIDGETEARIYAHGRSAKRCSALVRSC